MWVSEEVLSSVLLCCGAPTVVVMAAAAAAAAASDDASEAIEKLYQFGERLNESKDKSKVFLSCPPSYLLPSVLHSVAVDVSVRIASVSCPELTS